MRHRLWGDPTGPRQYLAPNFELSYPLLQNTLLGSKAFRGKCRNLWGCHHQHLGGAMPLPHGCPSPTDPNTQGLPAAPGQVAVARSQTPWQAQGAYFI